MYLSRLLLPTADRYVYSLLSNVYRLHQSILTAFPSGERGGGRVLFRLEPELLNGRAPLLVQSEIEPDWDKQESKEALRFSAASFKPFQLHLAPGQKLRFRLRANPTVKREGKRLALVGEESQRKWLDRHLTNDGFSLMSVVVIDEGKTTARRPRNGQTITILTVRYEGIVVVSDSNLAIDTVRTGLGPAKAFGCGLLSVARA